jgi:zinc protease
MASAQPAGAGGAPLELADVLPFDPVVRTGTLTNGMRYYVRQNGRPADRLLVRLAVDAGSLDEGNDQRGLAHFLEHMAFNGSRHFEPGELIKYFESAGARLGPHVNAHTSFTETVYRLDVPSDRPELISRALMALADFAGRLTLDGAQVEKERGVVIEEWRGGLGAASRIRDKQVPVLYHGSRYAERLPIGVPEVLRTAPVERLRHFYDTFYRPDRMAIVAVGDIDAAAIEESIRSAFRDISPRDGEPPPRTGDVPLHEETLVSVVTDPEVARSSVSLVFKRADGPMVRVADYRREIMQRLIEHMMNERFTDLARRPDAPVLGAGAGESRLSPEVDAFMVSASVEDGRIEDGATFLAREARRVREHGFGTAELERARRWLTAMFERAYNEREKTESASYAREYVSHFLSREPSPGIVYEYRLVQQFLPGIADADVAALVRELMPDTGRVVLAVSPQKEGVTVPSPEALRAALARVADTPVTPWVETELTRELMPNPPAPAEVVSRRELAELGVTVVRFANGLEAWLKPTDFKNDEVVFTMYSRGGASLVPPPQYVEASLAASYASLSGAAGLTALELEKLLAGKLVGASPYVSFSTHGLSGTSAPAQLETALQLLHQRVVEPGNDPEAFHLLKRQLDAAVTNRLQNPLIRFSDKVNEVNTSGHYTAEPLSAERVARLDRDRMAAFYRDRFANAADFTLFMAGTFTVDEALPLLARYVGTLPSTGTAAADFRDAGIRFPAGVTRAEVRGGREPRSQAVVSFFADPDPRGGEQEVVGAAIQVLESVLRDLLREDLGQTYGVSVELSQPLPQRGAGHIEVRFGSDPANVTALVERILQEVRRLQQEGPPADRVAAAKEGARRSHETSLRQNGYWLGRLQSLHLFGRDPLEILQRPERIDAVTPAAVQQAFQKYFPLDRYTVVTLKPQD